ncbi:uncharacterized protein SCHCODRAFT_02517028 [Schizophyllum commune H4-8]|uniref:F-box domain-containing protein n=1 Tax=Schizophyllum commune (strain H4-8 / FGSC 9210) TaxID=578458 RepID=D8QHD5_SCHCM|nr:uncharacterized protein SCHCODRAFT_02517028 [Schizophyllum commune H4-8]KAI5887137.1 hypothetical protein SCHCODRAFT_02517028 [Schizophyllum commune H4-8]
MHRVVQILELRTLIFADCNNRSLVALAQTCSDFFETAAPIIWRSLSSLGPLFACLPQSVADLTDPSQTALQQQTPQLSSFTLDCHLAKCPADLFLGCDTLKSLHLSSVDRGIMKAIARLPRLQELHIAFPFSLSFDTSAFTARAFASLTSLTISQGRDSTIIAFLSLLSVVSLVSVTIRSSFECSPRYLCENLKKHGAKMRQLKIEAAGTDISPGRTSSHYFPATTSSPSASFHRAMSSWTVLAKRTPRLRRLSIDFDATRVVALPDLDETLRNPRSALAYLNVGYSPIGDADAVASILSTWFPKLQAVNYLRHYPEKQYGFDGWAQVMNKVSGGREPPASVVRSVLYS